MREKITSGVFVAILVAFFALVMVCPKDEQASVLENRPLAEMPKVTADSVFSGGFSTEYETYLTDNVGFRSNFVRLGTIVENIRGIQREEAGRIVELANGNSLVLTDGKIMEVFKANPAVGQEYARVLNAYGDKFSQKCNMYVMLVPTQIEFDNSKYRSVSHSEKEAIDGVYSSLNNFKTVNVYDKLKEKTGEYIYFRTDHHWTQRGAYYGYESLMEEMGETPVPLEDMTVGKANGFLGYLYNQANVPEYSKYADEIEYFEAGENYIVNGKKIDDSGEIIDYKTNIYCYPKEGTTPAYSTFMGGDHPFAEVNTNVKNGKVVLVIKDSYANTVLPFLTNNYETVLVVDPRSFYGTVSQLTEEYEIDDIVFINYAFSTTFADFVGFIEKIM